MRLSRVTGVWQPMASGFRMEGQQQRPWSGHPTTRSKDGPGPWTHPCWDPPGLSMACALGEDPKWPLVSANSASLSLHSQQVTPDIKSLLI